MTKELRHKSNRREADASLSPSDLSHLLSKTMGQEISALDVIVSTWLFHKDRNKPRYELKLRLAKDADLSRFPDHVLPVLDEDGKPLVCTRIRAIQGHSTNVNIEGPARAAITLGMRDFPALLAHATSHENLDSIIKKGLLPGGLGGNRDENHFAPVRPERDADQRWMERNAQVPGMRANADVVIYFDTKAVLANDVKLFQSAADAVLTKNTVPAIAIISVRARENGAVKYFRGNLLEKCTEAEILIVVGKNFKFCQAAKGTKRKRAENDHEGPAGRRPRPSVQETRQTSEDENPEARQAEASSDDDKELILKTRKEVERDAKLSARLQEEYKTPCRPVVVLPAKLSENASRRATDAGGNVTLRERKAEDAGVCSSCGAMGQCGMTQCTRCHCRLQDCAAEDREANLENAIKAIRCVRRLDGRGIRSSSGDRRLDYLHRYKRARRLEYESVADRFQRDRLFRNQMQAQGWNDETIVDIDEIASADLRANPGRTWYERQKYEGFYDKHIEDPQGRPNRDAKLAPCNRIANVRRKQETHYWSQVSWVSHRETDAAASRDDEGKTKGKGKRRGYPEGKGQGQPSENPEWGGWSWSWSSWY